MLNQFSRTQLLLGTEAMEKLKRARVAVFGLGGVGGAAAWGLSRSGVGFLRLVDCDEVAESNLNRQMVADWETIGMRKTDAAERMIRRYNREVMLDKCDLRANEQTIPALCDGVDLVIDAIDDIPAKVGLAVYCTQHGIDILSSMGTGNKLRPDAFSIKDLSKTSGDPLARILRRKLKDYGITHLSVCISDELPARVPQDEQGKNTPASIAFVPPSAGLVLAGEAVRRLLGRRA